MANNKLTGYPRAFETEDKFKGEFLEYIAYCKQNEQLANIAGFCVFCDINRDTFYAQKEYYSDTYKKIQEVLEDVTINSRINDTFKIFYMKNKFGYKDKSEIDNNIGNKDDKPFNIDFKQYSIDQLKELIKDEDKGTD